ncbi:MAG: methylated-DNA--[Erysipelotrichaceae bacterium]|nr:methylated-DNA--[protein]-cysteine S-methyltransferase [Erysipelotrichaceae bacterium]
MTYTGYYESPIGILEITADEEALTGLSITEEKGYSRENEIIRKTVSQLKEYFSGKRESFDLPLKLNTTPFRKRVYEALLKVPYGSTVSYKDLTIMAGNRRGFQATGQAMHFNPIMIVIPCHRVINNDGSIGGYGSHIEVKKYLLRMEGGWKMDYNKQV